MHFVKRLWKSLAPFPAANPDDFLLPENTIRRLLERERQRADRGRRSLSMLTLDAQSWDAARLSTALEARLRSTDVAGWLEPGQLAIVLPDTPHTGASKVAEDLEHLLVDGRPSGCRIFVHPYGQHQIQPERGRFDDGHDDTDQDDHHDDGGSAGLCGENGFAPKEQLVAAAGGRIAQPLETIFARPMPVWKRLVDVTGATVGLVMLSPLMLTAAAAIRLTSKGPIFFAQQREGLAGQPFTIWKFRTMVVDAEEQKKLLMDQNEQDGPAFKIKHDPRITPVGQLLRVTSIDELPQLWNVIRGEMSLVGPRPLPCHESQACDSWQRRRLEVTPGLTCIWQIVGRSSVSFAEWMRMDLQYSRDRSLWRDLSLIVKTIPAVVARRGAR